MKLSIEIFITMHIFNAHAYLELKLNHVFFLFSFSTLSKLPRCHYELLRHLMCVLYHIDKKSEENLMTAYNLSVCIAPSMLWPKGNNDPLSTPPAFIQYMIQHCPEVFGVDTATLFGDVVEQKMRQDSSTDSDSMHSVLSSHSKFQQDVFSIRTVVYKNN